MLAALLVPALYLNWEAPQGCPDRTWMLAEVKRLRGELTVHEHSDDVLLAARATVTPKDGEWQVEIDTVSKGHSGHRSLTSDTCQRAGESAAVVLSLALTNAVTQAEAPPPPADAPPMQVSQPLAPEQPAAPITLGMALTGGGRAGPLPSFFPDAGLTFELISHYVRVELSLFTPAPNQHVGTGNYAADLWIPVHGELGIAVPVLRERVQLDFAADVATAYIDGKGVGAINPKHNGNIWFAVEGGAVLHLGLWRSLQLKVDGRVGYAFDAPKFVIQTTVVYPTPPLTGRVGVGLEWLF